MFHSGFFTLSVYQNLVCSVLTGPRVSNCPSPDLLQLRVLTNLEPNPALQVVLGDLPGNFSPLDQTSPSVTVHNLSQSEQYSPVSLKVSDTLQRRSRCSGETWNLLITTSWSKSWESDQFLLVT